MKSKFRAFTLIEALVTMFVIGLIMTIMAFTIQFCYRRYLSEGQRQDRQSQVLIFSQRLGIELRRAPPASLVAHSPLGNAATGDLMLSLLTPTTADGSYQRNTQGALLYQAYLVYYCDSRGLCGVRVPLASPTTLVSRQTVGDIINAATLPGARCWVSSPCRFQLQDALGNPTTLVSDPLMPRVTLDKEGPGQLPFTFVVDLPG